MMKINYYMILPLLLIMMMLMIMIMPMKNYKFHPINLIVILILLTLNMTIFMNIILKSWMSYILFLTIIGGLMIIFMYITSLTNNEILMINKMNLLNFFKKMFITMLLFTLTFFFIKNLNLFSNNMEFWKMNYSKEIFNEMNLNFLYNKKKLSLIFIINYLFYSMICIMNICYKFKIPLRQLNNYE